MLKCLHHAGTVHMFASDTKGIWNVVRLNGWRTYVGMFYAVAYYHRFLVYWTINTNKTWKPLSSTLCCKLHLVKPYTINLFKLFMNDKSTIMWHRKLFTDCFSIVSTWLYLKNLTEVCTEWLWCPQIRSALYPTWQITYVAFCHFTHFACII